MKPEGGARRRAMAAGVVASVAALVPIYLAWSAIALILDELAGGSILFGASASHPWWWRAVMAVVTVAAVALDVLVGVCWARRVSQTNPRA